MGSQQKYNIQENIGNKKSREEPTPHLFLQSF